MGVGVYLEDPKKALSGAFLLVASCYSTLASASFLMTALRVRNKTLALAHVVRKREVD